MKALSLNISALVASDRRLSTRHRLSHIPLTREGDTGKSTLVKFDDDQIGFQVMRTRYQQGRASFRGQASIHANDSMVPAVSRQQVAGYRHNVSAGLSFSGINEMHEWVVDQRHRYLA